MWRKTAEVCNGAPETSPPLAGPPGPWVGRAAEQIEDPVSRLRFLRAAASGLEPGDRPLPERLGRPARSRTFLGSLWFLIVALALAPASLEWFSAANRLQASLQPPRPAPAVVDPGSRFQTPRAAVRLEAAPEIWQVESTTGYETYSNGLRIDNRAAVANRPRSYLAFPVAQPDDTRGEPRSTPAGIVFHTSESPQAPFEPSQNSVLKRAGKSLLNYVDRARAYNFLIDRFGRVYRIVQESHAANHAGYSVWADDQWLYLNLNDSFLGVAFEAGTLPGHTEFTVNPAQVRAAAMLTEMLRRRYRIPARNCVTHAQVSVSPASMLVGYHTDWASNFPFEQLGLPDNYAAPSPAVLNFGFDHDTNFQREAGSRLYRGIESAERGIRERALAAHLSPAAYKQVLQRRFWSHLSAARRQSPASGEPSGESDSGEPE